MTDLEELEKGVIGDFIPLELIQSCEKDYKKKKEADRLTDEDRFSYGWHLIKSRYKDDVRKGIKIMGELCQDGVDQRDYFYFMALGYYKLEEYSDAEECIDRVLNMEPNNLQARQLKQLTADKIRRDGLITAGVVGGAALVGAVAVGAVALLGAGVIKLASKR